MYAQNAPPPSTEDHQEWREALHESFVDPEEAEARAKVQAGLSNIVQLGRGVTRGAVG